MIYRCLLCHGIIRIGAGVRYAKGWCQNCGAEYDFEIVPDGIFRPSCVIVEELPCVIVEELQSTEPIPYLTKIIIAQEKPGVV